MYVFIYAVPLQTFGVCVCVFMIMSSDAEQMPYTFLFTVEQRTHSKIKHNRTEQTTKMRREGNRLDADLKNGKEKFNKKKTLHIIIQVPYFSFILNTNHILYGKEFSLKF